jgi:hypothetical protein
MRRRRAFSGGNRDDWSGWRRNVSRIPNVVGHWEAQAASPWRSEAYLWVQRILAGLLRGCVGCCHQGATDSVQNTRATVQPAIDSRDRHVQLDRIDFAAYSSQSTNKSSRTRGDGNVANSSPPGAKPPPRGCASGGPPRRKPSHRSTEGRQRV